VAPGEQRRTVDLALSVPAKPYSLVRWSIRPTWPARPQPASWVCRQAGTILFAFMAAARGVSPHGSAERR
jgi:hypothetical protein